MTYGQLIPDAVTCRAGYKGSPHLAPVVQMGDEVLAWDASPIQLFTGRCNKNRPFLTPIA